MSSKINTQPISHRYRGRTSSAQENEKNLAIYRDILNHYETLSNMEYNLKKATLIYLSSGDAFDSKVNDLLSKIKSLEERIKSLEKGTHRLIKYAGIEDMRSSYPNIQQDEQSKENRGIILTNERVAHLDISNFTARTYIQKDNGAYFIPKEIEVELERESSTAANISFDGVKEMFNEKKEDFFIYDIEYENEKQAPKQEVLRILVKLPDKISSKKKINSVRFNTYPLTSTSLDEVNVIYRGVRREVSFTHKEKDEELKGQIKLSFEPMYAEAIEFKLKSKDLIKLIGRKSRRILGSNLVEVGYEVPAEGSSLILAKFDMSDNGIYTVEDLQCEFQNRGAFSYSKILEQELKGSIYTHEILRRDADGTLRVIPKEELHYLKEKELWVAIRLNQDPHNGVIPLLKGVKLQIVQS